MNRVGRDPARLRSPARDRTLAPDLLRHQRWEISGPSNVSAPLNPVYSVGRRCAFLGLRGLKRDGRNAAGRSRGNGPRRLLVYCGGYRCAHSVIIDTDPWPDDVRLSDLEAAVRLQGLRASRR